MIRDDWSTLRKLMFMKAAGSKAVEATSTGNPLTFQTDLAKSLKSLVVPFSDENGVTGVTANRTGKNIFDKSTGIELTDSNILVARNQGKGLPIKLKKGVTYTVSCNSDTDPSEITLRVPFTSQQITVSYLRNYLTYTPQDDIDVAINFFWTQSKGNRPEDATDIMIEVSNVQTAFEPYTGQTYTVSWQDSAGNPTEGYIDLVSGILTVTEPEAQTYQLTPQQITSLIGTNTIWSDANGDLTAKYLKKG